MKRLVRMEIDLVSCQTQNRTAAGVAGLAAAALLHHAAEAGNEATERRSRAIYDAVIGATAAGVRTPDLGGHAGTTEFTDEVIARVRLSLGS